MIVPGTTFGITLEQKTIRIKDKGRLIKTIPVKGKSFDQVRKELERFFYYKGKILPPALVEEVMLKIGIPKAKKIFVEVEEIKPEPESDDIWGSVEPIKPEIKETQTEAIEPTSKPIPESDKKPIIDKSKIISDIIEEVIPTRKSETKVEAPAIETKVKTPTTETKVEVPPVETKVEAPATETKVEAPAIETKVEAPAIETKVEAPAIETKVEAPTTETKVEAPTTETKVEAPTTETKVEGPPVETKVEAPTTETKVEESTHERKIIIPQIEKTDEEVLEQIMEETIKQSTTEEDLVSYTLRIIDQMTTKYDSDEKQITPESASKPEIVSNETKVEAPAIETKVEAPAIETKVEAPTETPTTEKEEVETLVVRELPKYKVKVVVLGEDDVGMSSLFENIGFNEQEEQITSLSTMRILTKEIPLKDVAFDTEIWPLNEAKKIKITRGKFYADAEAAIIVYSVVDRWSYQSIDYWVKEINQMLGPETPILIVGNKIDLRIITANDQDMGEAPVSKDEALEKIKLISKAREAENGLPALFTETSIITGPSIENGLKELLKIIKEKRIKK